MRKITVLAAVAVAAIVLAACGGSDSRSTAGSGREVKITMTDNAYQPASLHVTKGETITFTFVNKGKADHEALLGNAMAQADHEKEMSDMGAMNHGNADVLTVKPGRSGTLTHTFDTAGDMLLGCHEPGHYKAGMKLDVAVS